jgi:hypothetical protein
MHEILVSGDQVEDARLLFGAPETLELDGADAGHEFLIENELDDLEVPVLQVNGPLDPELDLVLQPEALFLGVVANEIGPLAENDDIVVFHLKKVARVGMDPKSVGDPMGRKPLRGRFLQALL